jgi:hypothetical protein
MRAAIRSREDLLIPLFRAFLGKFCARFPPRASNLTRKDK